MARSGRADAEHRTASEGRGVGAGAAHACGKKATNNVVCWGKNDQGQLGNGSTKAHDYTLATVSF